jgi:hypothetical protein
MDGQIPPGQKGVRVHDIGWDSSAMGVRPRGQKKQVARQRLEGQGSSHKIPKRKVDPAFDEPDWSTFNPIPNINSLANRLRREQRAELEAEQRAAQQAPETESADASSSESGTQLGPPEGANPYPDTSEVVTEEDRKHWKKIFTPARPRADRTSWTRETTARI